MGSPVNRRVLRLVPSGAPEPATTHPDPESGEHRAAGTPPDTLALAQVALGNVGALGEVYDRHAEALLRFATPMVGRTDAEDLVHATFMKTVQIAGSYDGRGVDARRWLFGILVRILRERRRSLARFARALLRLAWEPEPAAPSVPEGRSDLESGLARLAEPKRVVLLLAEVEGYTCPEIAQMLEVPVGTVWTRLHHARQELRAHYDEAVT